MMKSYPLAAFLVAFFLFFTALPNNSYAQILIPEGHFKVERYDVLEPMIFCNQFPGESGSEITTITLGSNTFTFVIPQTSVFRGVAYDVNENLTGKLYHLYFCILPIVDITVTSGLDQVDQFTEQAGSTVVTDTTGESLTADIGLRYRGATSLSYPKKSFRMQLRQPEKSGWKDLDASLLGMREDKKWLLLPMYNEKMRINNKVSHALWMDMHKLYYADKEPDAKSTISTRYVMAFIDGAYRGIYLLTENTDRKQYKLKKEKADHTVRGELYKGAANGTPNYFGYLDPTPLPAYSSETWSGWELEYPDSTNWENMYQLGYFANYSTDEVLKKELSKQFKLDNLRDYILFVNLIMARDNLGKNSFLAKYQEDDPYFYGVWDLDGTWGYDYTSDRNSDHTGLLSNHFFDRIMALDPDNFKEKLASRWFDLRKNILATNNLHTRLLSPYHFLQRNGIYSIEEAVGYRAGNWIGWWLSYGDDEMQYALDWTTQRANWLDDYFRPLVPLPVNLLSFNALKKTSEVLVKWETSMEHASKLFEIERSADARTWSKIGELQATGESTMVKNYSFSDKQPLADSNYYRLKIIDFDDTSEYSKIIGITWNSQSYVTVFPNPARDKIYFLSVKDFAVKKIELYDKSGKMVISKETEEESDFLEVKGQSGVYILKIIGEGGISETRNVLIE